MGAASHPARRRPTIPELPRRTVKLALLLILGLGILVRLVHFWAIAGTAFPKIPLVFIQSDLHANLEWAQRIQAGDWLGRETYHPYFVANQGIAPLETWYRWWGGREIFHQAPLYPYLLATLLALCGGSLPFVTLAQLVMGAVRPLVVFALTRRLFDERVGLVAATLTALYGPFIFYEGVLLRDWLPTLLEPLALLLLLRARDNDRAWGWLVAGMALGLAILTKESVVLLLLLAGVWLLWEEWPAWRRAGRAGALLVVGLVLCLSPLLLRNLAVGAPVLALSNRAAESFIAGNAVDSSPVGLGYNLATERKILERSGGRLPLVIRETLGTYQGNFALFFGKQARKLQGLLDPYEVPNNESYYYGREISPVLWLTFGYGLILPLGVAGFFLSLPARRRQRLLYVYLPAVLAGPLFSTVLARYRLSLVPVLILYAAACLLWVYDSVREKDVPRALGGFGLVLIMAVAQHLWLPLRSAEEYFRPNEYKLASMVYASEGRFDRAVAEIQRLREKARQHFSLAKETGETFLLEGDYRSQWAARLLEAGKREEARRQAGQAEGVYGRQINVSYPNYNLGLLYLKLNEPVKARAFLERFLTLTPQDPLAAEVRRLLAGL